METDFMEGSRGDKASDGFGMIDRAISRIDIPAERRASIPPFPMVMAIVGLIAIVLIGLLLYDIYVS